MEETKICTKCGSEKPIEQFQKDKQKKSGRRPDCGKCNSKRCTERARIRRKEINFNTLKWATGINKETYLELLKAQSGVCAICGKLNVNPNRNLAIDHNHETLIIRGLLCGKCNFGLGYFNEDEKILLKAIEYLKNNQSSRSLIFKNKRKTKEK